MNAPLSLSTTEKPDIPMDSLTQLQLRIARRADELERLHSGNLRRDCWLDAEREIMRTGMLGVGELNTA